ncbi:hypothetical protein ACLHDG_00160 [Sulfurovum sp. CS9]|uniref:hypothetical protein n=1 Tax=Sulfurovum sp. CS9 TaxID=3391146 RepID=UPI0039EA2BE5
MLETQHKLYETRTEEMAKIANSLEELPISDKWVERFTATAFYRGWRRLDSTKKLRIINIGQIDSPAVAIIVEQKQTKLSLEKIERIAIVVTDEPARAKIKNHLLTRSWKKAKKDIDLIIASYESNVA